MKKFFTLFVGLLLSAPLVGAYAQCSGQYSVTYPVGSGTNTVNINNGSGPVSSSYCPASAGSQQLVAVPASPGSMRLDRTYNGTTTTLQSYTTVPGTTYTFALPTVTSQAVYTMYSVISCNNQKNSTVTFTLAPQLELTASLITLCSGGTSTLTATGSSSGNYTWSAPGMATVTNTGTLTVSPTTSTTYTVTAPTSCGTNTQQQLTIVVPTLTAASSASSVCSGTSVTLTATSNVAGATFTWTNVGTGATVGTGSPITVTPGSGTTTYRVTSSNPSGCTNTSTRDVPVSVVTPAVPVSPASPSIVQGNSVTLTAASNLSGATYAWRTGGAGGTVVGTGASLTVSPSFTTTYTVTGTAGSCSSNQDATVTVTSPTPLPVELKSFEARWTAAAPILTWATASELDNDHFRVERSLDSRSFEPIGRVAGAGSSSAPTFYRYEDASATQRISSTLYYRLAQVDVSGKTSYSAVKVVKHEGKEAGISASVYPNPFDKAPTLRLDAPQAGPVVCIVRDLLGRPVLTHTFTAAQGFQQLTLPTLSSAKAGLYYLTVRQGEQQQVLRLQQQ